MSAPFVSLGPWLRHTFGRPVHRVALDAGSTCPNRDGTRGFGGCAYCDVEGSGTGALRSGTELAEQLVRGIRRVRRRDSDPGVIAYFQSYSNTYVETERLREVLAVVEPHIGDPIVAVSVATRPDTLSESALDCLGELGRKVPVWVELGLEAADDGVLERIHRFHTVEEFQSAVRRCHGAGLAVIGHAILGLPGDGREGARRTAGVLAQAGVEGVKVHNLMVLRRTRFERDWRAGELSVLDVETYVQWLADFVERLHAEQVLHRVTGDAPLAQRLAPRWEVHKNEVRELLAAELGRRGSRQGTLCTAPDTAQAAKDRQRGDAQVPDR
ncbi:MAG: TIGR01212 family radical SAM protein [Planctomycetota bacterium]|nr:TIGR01212 family radical SAM protein [Planctomycetota bacterium]